MAHSLDGNQYPTGTYVFGSMYRNVRNKTFVVERAGMTV